MFGGVGLYAGNRFFAIMMDDTIYLKVDDATRPSYEAAGSRAFNPFPERGGGSMQYYEVPLAVLEDADELARWAKRSIAVAAPRRATPARSRTPSGPAASRGMRSPRPRTRRR
ncbi:MAG: TfoX/Sxy family protein [Acidobacteria bacterium]|nr:TfoX/Sxy family protein [Acidobacteriota bacterium]